VCVCVCVCVFRSTKKTSLFTNLHKNPRMIHFSKLIHVNWVSRRKSIMHITLLLMFRGGVFDYRMWSATWTDIWIRYPKFSWTTLNFKSFVIFHPHTLISVRLHVHIVDLEHRITVLGSLHSQVGILCTCLVILKTKVKENSLLEYGSTNPLFCSFLSLLRKNFMKLVPCLFLKITIPVSLIFT
jgi:hypothetical protein